MEGESVGSFAERAVWSSGELSGAPRAVFGTAGMMICGACCGEGLELSRSGLGGNELHFLVPELGMSDLGSVEDEFKT